MINKDKSFLGVPKVFKICLYFVTALLLFSCRENEAQRDFEQKAFAEPSGITEMSVTGVRVENGEQDTDDWRTGPDFVGSFSVETPAYPNPVNLSGNIQLLVSVNSFQSVSGLQVYAYQQPGRAIGPLFTRNGQLDTGFIEIRINVEQFASSTGTGNLGNLYRIVIYDANLNVMSYGDVEVK